MSNHTSNRWDIFCKIVDNYGDIGVCWRLSRQLAHEHQLQVRLFIDDFATASRIIPALDSTQPSTQTSQIINGVEICTWPIDLPESEINPADVVIETFGCVLPDEYIQQMQSDRTIWINLEYLSAEDWVSDFHAKPSRHPMRPLTKHFFFPGFCNETGGLIRENNLIAARNEFVSSTMMQKAFWQKLGIDSQSLDKLAVPNAVKISLFCYPQADINSLFLALMQSRQPISLFLPFNGKIADLNAALPDFRLTNGEVLHKGNLTIYLLPFLSQADYDRLLWACDLNFVRGEDSWIRAIWAGKPFIWQPYVQAEDVHIHKLDAFVKAYASDASADVQSLLQASYLAWSRYSLKSSQPDYEARTQDETAEPELWQSLIDHLPALHRYANQQTNTLATQPDLATKLVIFSENLRKNEV